ncbi:MAG: cobalamin-dependent protein [Thermodesulfobacteriota bacterium]|nr:cobalamin-dependent protein [Thermodesulfobacteriota bacterium]
MKPQGKRRARILIAKSDQDAHESSVRYLARLVREEGIEVIFLRYFLIDEIAEAAMEEDVDLIALSFYGSGLMHDTSRLMNLIDDGDLERVGVLVGGTINGEERDRLIQMGVTKVFMPGIGTLHDVAQFVKNYVSKEE